MMAAILAQPRARVPASGRAHGRRPGGAQRSDRRRQSVRRDALWRSDRSAAGAERHGRHPWRLRRARAAARRVAGAARPRPAGARGASDGRPAGAAGRVPLREGQPRAAEGHLGAFDRGLAAGHGRAHPGCQGRLRRAGADPDPGPCGRARARGAKPRSRRASRPALAVAADDCAPVDDAIASAWYRREVLPVHLRRLLLGERR